MPKKIPVNPMPVDTESSRVSSPLLCWDIFMDSYHRRSTLANDCNLLNKLSTEKKWVVEWDYESRLFSQGNVIIITDLLSRIVYSSSNIFEMNGYTPAELKGKSPKLFQGESTSPDTRLVIRDAIKNQQPFNSTILNYKKNLKPYYCHIEGYPLFNKNKELSHFIAFEDVVAAPSYKF